MSVFLRTGQGSAVSFPWWFYLLIVLPLQLLAAFLKAALWLLIFIGAGLLWLGRTAHEAWNERRPPHPEG